MGTSYVGGRATREPAVELVRSKLTSPPARPGAVRRSSLIERLVRAESQPIVSVAAPAGFGKTTLLSQWADHDDRAFAWVTVDESDNDPKVLLSYVTAALDAVEPVTEQVYEALASAGSSVPGSVVPRLGSAFSSMSTPVVLVLDDVHELHSRACWSALSVLADHVPSGSRLAFAGRTEPPLRLARLRTDGRVLEISAPDLALTRAEASSLLRNLDIVLAEDEIDALYQRTEGWPVGLYFAGLYLREGGTPTRAAVSFGGDDRFVSDYMESEFLARISREQREFLTRTAVLDRMCGSLCDAVLTMSGSAATLVDLERSNLLLVPLDRHREWYRYHRLFRDMLQAELHRVEPDAIPTLHRRAAEWCERNGALDEALEYDMNAGDADAAARLLGVMAFPAYQRGKAATVERWFGWLEDHAAMEDYPAIDVLAAVVPALTGKPADAERLAAVAQRGALTARPPEGRADAR